MNLKKLSIEEQKNLIPDDAVHEAFLRREDIANLSQEKQEEKWQEHLVHLNNFRAMLSEIPSFVP